jgi:hypothetical protein
MLISAMPFVNVLVSPQRFSSRAIATFDNHDAFLQAIGKLET